MFDTKKQRGIGIAVVGLAVVLAAFVVDLVGERLVQGDAEVAAQELEAVLDRFESVADVQLAMANGELGLPEGSSLRFVDSLHVVALQEVRTLTEVRCVRVEASAPGVESTLRIDQTVVSRGLCDR